jgi:hypothetical protein
MFSFIDILEYESGHYILYSFCINTRTIKDSEIINDSKKYEKRIV